MAVMYDLSSGPCRGETLVAVSDVRRLKNSAMLAGLSDAACQAVVAAGSPFPINDGTTVFVQGDPADFLYVLLEGRLKISQITSAGNQVVIRYIGAAEMFGCVAMGGVARYPATAIAVGNCLAMRWTRHAMGILVERYPRVALNGLSTIGMRMKELQERFAELANDRVEQRIARAVLRLVVQAGERTDDGIRIAFPISRQDIGDMTGTTLHTVSRTLSGWEERGIVKLGRQQVTVTDMDGIAFISGGNISPEAA